MNEIQNAFIVLLSVIVIISIILFLYKKQNKNNNMYLESYANYQDVKTKTINWCDKMKNAGLLDSDQFDSCVSTFQDAKSGMMPSQFKKPNTGMDRNYSLYNSRLQTLSPNISGENSNIIMLVNNTGFYMACDKDSNVYFIKDINIPSVNQSELYFTLVPQSNNIYMIMSSYGKYLISNAGPSVGDSTIPTGMSSRQDWCASFTGKTIGPMTNWNVSVIDTNNNNNSISNNIGNKVTFESVQLNNFFLSSSQNSQDNSLIINYGSDETNIWVMIPKTSKDSSSNPINNYSTQYIVAKETLLLNLASIKSQIVSVQSFKYSLNKLQDLVRNNYNNIINYMNQILNNKVVEGSIDMGIEIPNISNSISANTKTKIINNILTMKNNYLQQIDDDIKKLDLLFLDLQTKENNINNEYQNFKNDITNKLNEINININTNNSVIDRQKDNYDKLNNEYLIIDKQKEKINKIDDISKINTKSLVNSNDYNYTLLILYPLLIFAFTMGLIYLIYITYKKFISNVAIYY